MASVGSTVRKSNKTSIAALLVLALIVGTIAPVAAIGASGDATTIGLGTIKSAPVTPAVSADDKLVMDEGDSGVGALLASAPRLKAPPKRVAAPAPKPAPQPAPKPAPRAAAAPAPAAPADAAAPAAEGDWLSARVSWYGPGLYGNRTASGIVLEQNSMVVAHRSLAFGTKIEFSYNGKTVVATVQDRGPVSRSLEFDLGPGVAKALGFGGVATVNYRFL